MFGVHFALLQPHFKHFAFFAIAINCVPFLLLLSILHGIPMLYFVLTQPRNLTLSPHFITFYANSLDENIR